MSEAAPVVDYIHAVDRELCLSFVNKVSRRLGEATNDHLTGYTGLVAWAESAGALNTATAALLCEQAAEKPAQAAAVFRRAVSLREALYRIFMQAIEGAPPQEAGARHTGAEPARRSALDPAGVAAAAPAAASPGEPDHGPARQDLELIPAPANIAPPQRMIEGVPPIPVPGARGVQGGQSGQQGGGRVFTPPPSRSALSVTAPSLV